MADFAGAAVVVFARAPELGRVCTRLQESLGAEAATDIYRRLLCHRLQQLMDIPARVEVWVEGQLEHPFFAPWQSSGSFAWFQQKGADLGERMRLHHSGDPGMNGKVSRAGGLFIAEAAGGGHG